jgi:hypothetical protein
MTWQSKNPAVIAVRWAWEMIKFVAYLVLAIGLALLPIFLVTWAVVVSLRILGVLG